MKTLFKGKFRSGAIAALLCAGLYLASASVLAVRAKGDNGAPDLPPVCENIEAPAGNKLTFRVYAVGVQRYGPTQRAFAALDESGRAALRRDLERLWTEHNLATDGSTSIAAEYLEVIATRG